MNSIIAPQTEKKVTEKGVKPKLKKEKRVFLGQLSIFGVDWESVAWNSARINCRALYHVKSVTLV